MNGKQKDDSLTLAPQDDWSLDGDELGLSASEPLTEARWAIFPAWEAGLDLAG